MKSRGFLPVALLFILTWFCHADDWPQFRGLDRDGRSSETGLLQKWPPSGPSLLWKTGGLGDGYSSAAISKGTIYITGMTDNKGFVFAFDLHGKMKWNICYGPEWNRSYRAARCTPTVDGDRLYVFSGLGVAYCFDSDTGDPVWSFDAFTRYKGLFPLWGMSENLLIDGDNVICSPGGSRASVIALNKKTGKVVWECAELTQQSTYCNPRVIRIGDNRIIVTMLRDSVVGIDAKTGKLLWQDDFDGYHSDRTRAVNAIVPVFYDGRIYTTSGYDNGSAMLQLSNDGTTAKRIWTDTVLDVHHGGVVLIDGYIYGANWTSNSRGNWACIRWADGKPMYDHNFNDNKGSIIYADGMLYCYCENDGDVALVKATPEKFDVVSSFRITEGTGKFWAHPSISDGVLYIRHGEYLMAYDIRQRQTHQ
jgi:outer membrane protein assembly factor BamB